MVGCRSSTLRWKETDKRHHTYWEPGMAFLVPRMANTVPPFCSGAVAEICRSVGRLLSSSGLQYKSYADDALDGRFPYTHTFGADRPVHDKNSYPSTKWKGLRVGVPASILKPLQLIRTALNPFGNCLRASSIVALESCHDSPWQGFVRGKELPTGSACGGGHIHVREAIANLERRQHQGFVIDSYTFVQVLKLCSKQKDLVATRRVNEFIIESGMDKHPYVANTLLNAYCRCGRLQDARRVFDGFQKKDDFTWKVMIGGYAKNDNAKDALEVFNRMRRGGAQPDELTCLNILNACASPLALKWGKDVHAFIKHAGFESDVRVGTALVQMYSQCGCISEARRVFEKLTNRDVVTWNAMIGSYSKSGSGVKAYRLFLQMQQEGFVPNAVTYLSILNASASAGALEWVKEVHSHALRVGLESDLRVANALVRMHAKSGSIGDARVIFDRMKTRDLITWNIMIDAYAKSGFGEDSYHLLLEMKRDGFKPDGFTYASILNTSASAGALQWVTDVHRHVLESGLESDLRVGSALVHMYAKIGRIADARAVFNRMKTRDVITWTVMIRAYAESGCGVESYEMLLRMQREGLKPDAFTYTSILNASASAGALGWVKAVHSDALKAGLEWDLRLGNALIHAYTRSGSIGDARVVFDRMKTRDVMTWNVMMGGLAQHGCGHEALKLFRQMNKDSIIPDGITFVAVLSACCHAGLLDDGHRLFLAMTQDYGIKPDVVHYTCMVDLLGRAGRLEEAKFFIWDMPIEPDAVIWKALLGACRTYGNVELGELAAKKALKLQPKDPSIYVLLSNIYAAAGKWENVSSVRTMMQDRGLWKEPGRSWIEVNSKIHEFVVGDTSHPEAKAIYAELKRLTEKLKAEGYIPDTKLVLQDIDEEDKELALCSHSEKLAIAYGLMRIPGGKPIIVYKNLRVCSDCHTATKFISKVTGREIIARDATRFHHFKDGVCSCGDYW